MSNLKLALQSISQRIDSAAQAAHRCKKDISLLAVSKKASVASIRDAYEVGQQAFGESYVRPALEKMAHLEDLRSVLTWHFIGPIQRNKTQWIAEHFDWVHSVDRLIIAQRLSDQRPAHLPSLNICLQVNISGETTKQGVALHEILPIAQTVAKLPRLQLRGLMAIPQKSLFLHEQRQAYRLLKQSFEAIRTQGLRLDTLSMGMSNDLEAAILEGATIVRVGTAIFSPDQR